jgi:hypothetical protein
MSVMHEKLTKSNENQRHSLSEFCDKEMSKMSENSDADDENDEIQTQMQHV